MDLSNGFGELKEWKVEGVCGLLEFEWVHTKCHTFLSFLVDSRIFLLYSILFQDFAKFNLTSSLFSLPLYSPLTAHIVVLSRLDLHGWKSTSHHWLPIER